MNLQDIKENLTAILVEFVGKVKYYELPQDLVGWTYEKNDIERARRRILDEFTLLLISLNESLEKEKIPTKTDPFEHVAEVSFNSALSKAQSLISKVIN